MTAPDRDHGGTPGWRERLAGDLIVSDSQHSSRVIVRKDDLRAALAAPCPYVVTSGSTQHCSLAALVPPGGTT